MSFFKSLLLAIFATLFLTYVLGSSFMEVFGVHVYMEDEVVEPLKAISVAALLVVLLVVAALAIVLSVFGTIIFVGLLLGGSILLVAVGVFWPILLVAVVIYFITREPREKPIRHY